MCESSQRRCTPFQQLHAAAVGGNLHNFIILWMWSGIITILGEHFSSTLFTVFYTFCALNISMFYRKLRRGQKLGLDSATNHYVGFLPFQATWCPPNPNFNIYISLNTTKSLLFLVWENIKNYKQMNKFKKT